MSAAQSWTILTGLPGLTSKKGQAKGHCDVSVRILDCVKARGKGYCPVVGPGNGMVASSARLEAVTCLEGGIRDTANKAYSWDTLKIPNPPCCGQVSEMLSITEFSSCCAAARMDVSTASPRTQRLLSRDEQGDVQTERSRMGDQLTVNSR